MHKDTPTFKLPPEGMTLQYFVTVTILLNSFTTTTMNSLFYMHVPKCTLTNIKLSLTSSEFLRPTKPVSQPFRFLRRRRKIESETLAVLIDPLAETLQGMNFQFRITFFRISHPVIVVVCTCLPQ